MKNVEESCKKGQVTVVNLIGVFMALLLYFVAVVPILGPLIDDCVADLEASPNEFTAVTVVLLHSTLFFVLLALVLTALNYAIPQREGYYR